MTLTSTPTQDDVFIALQALFAQIVPTGTKVLRGPVNRAAQPAADHVVITPIHRKRLRTNIPGDRPDDSEVDLEQGTQLELQVDFYGPTASANWMDQFTTVFRSEYAVDIMSPACAPLYADEGRMMPLVTGEEQYLERWMVRAFLQYNPVVTVIQDYSDSDDLTVINVDASFPP